MVGNLYYRPRKRVVAPEIGWEERGAEQPITIMTNHPNQYFVRVKILVFEALLVHLCVVRVCGVVSN